MIRNYLEGGNTFPAEAGPWEVEVFEDDLPNATRCSQCHRFIPLCHSITETESEGWEYPTYDVDTCPLCDDGGCCDDYEYLSELKLWFLTLWVQLLIDLKQIKERALKAKKK